MTDHLTENARLRAALEAALNYIENTESELGITLDCGDTARAALATPAPDTGKEVMPDDEAANPADARYATSPGVTAGADYAAGFAEGIRRAAEVYKDQREKDDDGFCLWDYFRSAEAAILALMPDAKPAPDAVQEAARVPEIAALIEKADHLLQNYLRDELDEPDLCVDDEHWAAIAGLNSALRAIAESEASHE